MEGPQDNRQTYQQEHSGTSVPGRPPEPAGAQPRSSMSNDPSWQQMREITSIGVPLALANDPRRKSPALAAILSAVMPGIGQIYVGYYNHGFMNIFVVAGIIALMANAHYGSVVHNLLPFLGLFLAFYWIYNTVDAGRRAGFYNQALLGVGTVDMPEDMKLPKARGSFAGGIVLIGLGLLFFANTALGVSLDWLEQWWPMGLVLAGAYLVYLNMKTRKQQ